MPRLSSSQLSKLGDRLRHGAVPTPDDLALLSRFRDEHLPVLATSLLKLRGLPTLQRHPAIALTGRQKNAQTMLEKLRRERSMKLGRMRDVAGARIVIPLELGSRDVQDAIVAEVALAFPGSKTIDRRRDPRSGYRAVHVEAPEGGRHVEVQVRTYFQDLWAQVFERLGDQWGRQIRYGDLPTEADATVLVGGVSVSRRAVLSDLQDLSTMIDETERLLAVSLAESGAPVEPALRTDGASIAGRVRALKDLRDMFAALSEVLPSSVPSPLTMPVTATALARQPYLLVAYRRSSGTMVHCEPFAEDAVASIIGRRAAMEAEHANDPDYEVVLLATSEDQSLLKTHARYFRNARELVDA